MSPVLSEKKLIEKLKNIDIIEQQMFLKKGESFYETRLMEMYKMRE
tara:strand:+ start:847 stop:984 length:138 start_codon:yes stop_codon:yes gene_type:complete